MFSYHIFLFLIFLIGIFSDLISKKKGIPISKFLNKDSKNHIKTYDFLYNKESLPSSLKNIKIKIREKNIFKQYQFEDVYVSNIDGIYVQYILSIVKS